MPVARNNPPRMDLYMDNSIDGLNLRAELPEKFKRMNPKTLASSAQKLFSQAMELQEKGDAEMSYISFMKYMNLVSIIRKTPDYRKDEKYFNTLLGPKNVYSAIENAEKLQKELHKRYTDRAEESEARERLAKLDLREQKEREAKEQQAKEKLAKEKEALEKEKTPPVPDDVISSWSLDGMIKQKSTSFIIFDVRSREDFKESHIKHPNCLSIPEDILKPGLSAAALYRLLPPETKVEWDKRLTADVIVLVDWFGERIPGTAAYSLQEIFLKWDPSNTYRGTIKLLIGGYDDWLARFPLQTTNPHATVAAKPVPTAITSDITVFDIEYPDLDTEMRKPAIPPETAPIPPQQQPVVNRTTKPTMEVPRPAVEPSPVPPAVVSTAAVPRLPAAKPSAPQVDRNLKKEALMKHLQQEETLMERSLSMAQERLRQEQEWDRIRMEKESSLNSELTAQLQEREEQLIDMLKKMESDKKEQDLEIARLRQEVSKYEKQQESSSTSSEIPANTKPDEDQEQIQARIQEKEEKRANMYKEVERLRRLRKQQAEEMQQQQKQRLEQERRAKEQQEEQERLNQLRAKEQEAQKKKIQAEEEARRNLNNQQQFKGRKENINMLETRKLKDDSPSSSNFGFGSKMNRSHSTPDLAQALQNELDSMPGVSNAKAPKVERTLKPLAPNRTRIISRNEPSSKNRNFNPVYGNMGRGLTGLKNLGNTCYMNSILQCISNCTLLTNFFVDGSYRHCLNASNKGTGGEITDEVSSTLKALWSGQYRSISCKDLKNAVGRYKSTFRGYEQQDSHEFLTILIDWLHEELNETRVKVPLKEQNNHNIPDEKAADMAWTDYTSSNKSIIVQLFAGQQRSSLRCAACGAESVTFEPFFNLSLPIPQSRSQCNIMDCFELYTKPEQISGWSCPFCKHKKGASKTIDIWKLPPVLVVHLQRFYNDGLWRKRLTMVDFNVNDLDLEGMVKSRHPRYKHYKLYAVSNHYGTMDAGHYTAYCKNPEYNKWFKFDDQDVMEINGNEVRSAAAYILFYTAIDYQAPPVVSV